MVKLADMIAFIAFIKKTKQLWMNTNLVHQNGQ